MQQSAEKMDLYACSLVSAIFRGEEPDRDGVLSYLGKHVKPYMCEGRVCWRDAGVFHFGSHLLSASWHEEQLALRRGEALGRIGTYGGVPAVVGADVSVLEEVDVQVGISARECSAPEYAMFRTVKRQRHVPYFTVYTRTEKKLVRDLKEFVRSKKILKNPTEERALKYLNK